MLASDSIELLHPHPLSDYGRAKIVFAFKQAIQSGDWSRANRLEQFAAPDDELAQSIRERRVALVPYSS